MIKSDGHLLHAMLEVMCLAHTPAPLTSTSLDFFPHPKSTCSCKPPTLAAVPGSPQPTPWGTVCQPNVRYCFFNNSFLKNLALGNCSWDWARLSSFKISLRLKWDVYILSPGYVFIHLRWVSCFSLGIAAQQSLPVWSKYYGSHHETPSLPQRIWMKMGLRALVKMVWKMFKLGPTIIFKKQEEEGTIGPNIWKALSWYWVLTVLTGKKKSDVIYLQ